MGGGERFKEVFINNATQLDWPSFCQAYRKGIEGKGGCRYSFPSQEAWGLPHFIGNLPNIKFTSLHLHRSAVHVGRPYFYFGKREWSNGQYMVPVSITLDHANADPFLLDGLISHYRHILASGIKTAATQQPHPCAKKDI